MSGMMNWDRTNKEDKSTYVRARTEQTAMSAYVSSLQSRPTLSHEAMVELFKQYEEGGEQAFVARQKLVEGNLRLVIAIAKLYKFYKVPLEDLVQEGNIGLMKAVERFDYKRGFRFSTYASWWIKQSIGQFILKKRKTIRLPAHAVTVQRKLMRAAEQFREDTGIEPSLEELTTMIGASKTVVNATVHAGRGTVSMNQPMRSGNGSAGGNTPNTLENRLKDDSAWSNPFANVCDAQLMSVVDRVLNDLTPKEAAILRLRFGLVEEHINASGQYNVTETEATDIASGKGLR